MNVTLFSNPVGGIAHYSYALAEALQAAGLETTVLTYNYPDYELRAFPHRHRVVVGLDLGVRRHLRLLTPLRSLLGMLRTTYGREIVHFQWALGPRTDPVHWPLLRKLKKKIVYTAHDVLPHEPDIMSQAHCRWLYNNADALIVHGDRLKQLLFDRFEVGPERVHVIPHGNYNFFADTKGDWDRARARASFGWDDDERVVIFFGFIRPYKGLDDLIEACRIIRTRGLSGGKRFRLLIAGKSIGNHWQEGRYEELIAQAGLADQVTLVYEHIATTDIARFFHAADVVAIPYKRGSQSGVLQLAYSFSKAAVATRVGSLDEVVREDIARLVEPMDAGALADAIAELLDNPDLAERLGAAARRYAETELSWTDIARKTKALYDDLIAEAP